MMLHDRDEKYEGSDESEYHFSDDEEGVDHDASIPKEAAPASELKGDGTEHRAPSKRMAVTLVVFLALVYVVYKMVSPSTQVPETDIATSAATVSPVTQAKVPAATTQPVSANVMSPQMPQPATVAMPQPQAQQQAMPQSVQPQAQQQAMPQSVQPQAQQQAMPQLVQPQAQQQAMPQPQTQQQAVVPPAAVVMPQQIQPPTQQQAMPQPMQQTVSQPVPSAMTQPPLSSTQSSMPATASQPVSPQPDQPLASMPNVIPVQAPPVATTNTANSTIAEKMTALETDSARLSNQLQSDYVQKVNDFSTQNKELQEKVQTLNARMKTLEMQLERLMQALQKNQSSGSSTTVNSSSMEPVEESPRGSMEQKTSYNVQAIIPGRAWLKADNGETLTVAEGDTIKNLGRVSKIDPYDGVVEINTGNKMISLSYGTGT